MAQQIKNKKKLRIASKIMLAVVGSIALISCKGGGNAPSLPEIDSLYQLAYGSSSSDRTFLADRIAGNAPPKFAEVITRWKRFSGATYYPTVNSIVASPAYCNTTLDPSTGVWANSTSPAANPNSASACNTESMNSLSWIYLTNPDRLFNIQNTSFYNGFFSLLKFDTYISETVVSSIGTDDDSIGVSIAVYVDSNTNQVHTLSAYRTQGGNSPSLGWGLIYKVNGTVTSSFGNISVGGVNANSGGGDTLGWNGRNSKIRIERSGNIVKAYASPWGTGGVVSAIDPASLIELDLSDAANGLTLFMGPQSYGYESLSQAHATFSNLSFQTPLVNSDPEYLYDLRDNLVYIKKSSGIGYELVPGAKALDVLGYPKIITNVETQNEFSINSSTSFTPL